MWKPENRGRYDRRALRYPSDITDPEWPLIGPLTPPAKPGDGDPASRAARSPCAHACRDRCLVSQEASDLR